MFFSKLCCLLHLFLMFHRNFQRYTILGFYLYFSWGLFGVYLGYIRNFPNTIPINNKFDTKKIQIKKEVVLTLEFLLNVFGYDGVFSGFSEPRNKGF